MANNSDYNNGIVDAVNDKSLSYSEFHKSPLTSFKDFFAGFLKKSALGRTVYPIFQRCWRAYVIPRRQKRLQKHGAEAIKRLHNLLTKNNVQYYCDYGTLLGFVRDNGFIKHDDDIDISVQPDTIEHVELLKLFLNAKYAFVHGFNYYGRLMEFTVADSSSITVDVFFPSKTEVAGKIHCFEPVFISQYDYPNNMANTLIEYTFTEALNLTPMKINDYVVMVPKNCEDVLTSEYGPWKVPDANFVSSEQLIHRELDGFVYKISKEEALAL